MTKNEYTLFQKTKGEKKVWCVYFRDEEGNRLNPIYVSKLKKMVYKGKQRTQPIPDDPVTGREECIKVCEKSLRTDTTKEYIFNKEDKTPKCCL